MNKLCVFSHLICNGLCSCLELGFCLVGVTPAKKHTEDAMVRCAERCVFEHFSVNHKVCWIYEVHFWSDRAILLLKELHLEWTQAGHSPLMRVFLLSGDLEGQEPWKKERKRTDRSRSVSLCQSLIQSGCFNFVWDPPLKPECLAALRRTLLHWNAVSHVRNICTAIATTEGTNLHKTQCQSLSKARETRFGVLYRARIDCAKLVSEFIQTVPWCSPTVSVKFLCRFVWSRHQKQRAKLVRLNTQLRDNDEQRDTDFPWSLFWRGH